MAEKTFNTRLRLKYDTHQNWTTNNPVLLSGEVAIATIPAATGDVKQAPSVLMKVGDGASHYNDLKFTSGLAANVSNWALAATKPTYAATEITGLTDYVNNLDTNTTYQIVKVDNYNYKLQSKEIGTDSWTDVANGAIVIPKYDDTAVKADITALQGLVGSVAVATQIANAIAALDLANTYDAKGAAAQALADAKAYADGKDAAIAAAKKAGTDAQADVDALETKVGTVPEGKTVVQMISDAQTAATYDDSEVRGLIGDNADAIAAIEADYLKAADKTELQGQITTNKNAIATLNGTGAGSVKKIAEDAAAAAAAAIVGGADANYDTLKEIADFITTDITGAAGLANKVAANEAAIGENATAIGENAVAIEAVEGRMTTAEGKITTLEGKAHTHTNKALLDTYTQTEANLADAVSKKHAHANATVLNGITAAKVSGWDKVITDHATLAGKVGTVPDGKTVVQMISDAQTAATYDDSEVRGLIGDNADAISGVDGRVKTLETDALLKGDTLILNCGNSVI